MIIALLVGAITGWLLSMPIGPVNAAAISRTLKYGFKTGLAVGAGAAVMDVIYCGGAAQINQFLVESPVINLFFELAGFAALLYLGIHQLRTKLPGEHSQDEGIARGRRIFERLKRKNVAEPFIARPFILEPFVIGIVLYATNVMAIPEWIIISGLWRSWGVLGSGFALNVFFALGAGAGTLGWFSVLIGWIARHNRGFQPSTIRKINLGTSVAMLAFAGYFAYAIIFETQWAQVSTHFKENTGRIIDSINAK